MLVGYGCVELEENIGIAKDGSGAVKVNVVVPEDQAKAIPATKEDVERKVNREGMELTEFSRETKEGKVHASFAIKFKDVNLLMALGLLKGMKFEKDAKGDIVFEQKSGLEDLMTSEDPKALESAKGLKLKFTITFPNEVKDTNADKKEGATATWEYTFEKAQKLASEKKPLGLRATFSGEGVTFKVIEPKEEKPAPPKETPKE